MPKKKKKKSKVRKKKSKVRKKTSKKVKRRSKVRKRSSKKPKKRIKAKKENGNTPPEVVIKTKPEWVKSSLANKSKYQQKYSQSIKSNDEFWRKEGKRITWIKPYKKIKDVKYSTKEVKIKWFEDGTLNASANCIDRHLKDKKDKTDKTGRFIAVTVQFKSKFSKPVTLENIKKNKDLSHLALIKQSRLSVMPVDLSLIHI